MGTIAITAFYAGILALILVILSVRVVVVRRKVHRSFGDGGEDTLQPVIRGQGNFIEYVPLSLLLLGYLEFSGTHPYLIHGLGIALVVARILHPFGLQKDGGPTVPRVVGTVITWIVLVIVAVAAMIGFLFGDTPSV